MTATQFHQTGLDKLTPEELAAFNAWLANYKPEAVQEMLPVTTTKPAPAAATHNDASFGQEALPAAARDEPKRIETRIVGTFKGWSGGTVFTLENGQVWQQAEAGSFETHLENPTIVIKKLGFGYLLTVPGQGATVFVKRIR